MGVGAGVDVGVGVVVGVGVDVGVDVAGAVLQADITSSRPIIMTDNREV